MDAWHSDISSSEVGAHDECIANANFKNWNWFGSLGSLHRNKRDVLGETYGNNFSTSIFVLYIGFQKYPAARGMDITGEPSDNHLDMM